MPAPSRPIDPANIWMHADCFYQTLRILYNINPGNDQLAITIAQPAMVIGALTIELFLKCLICIETGKVPRIHHLRELFDMLTPKTRSRIAEQWDNLIVPYRKPEWDAMEGAVKITIARDLPTALTVGSEAFEKIRYSYEGVSEDLQYYLQDLPPLLGQTVLEMKPEWKNLRKPAQPVQPTDRQSPIRGFQSDL
jgi:hypothetical protein